VAFFLFYYLCLVGGEELANRLLLPPWLAMWLPNLVLGTWGLLATLRAIEIWRPRTPRTTPRGGGREGPREALPAGAPAGGPPA
jgi:lipopolysaccharide export system permease protein